MMRIDRLDHLVLTVKDIDTTVDFYTKVVGMQEVTFRGGRRALTFGHSKINLHRVGKEFDPKAARPTSGSADLCFIVDQELDDVVADLAAHGVPVEEGPVERTGAAGPINSVYVRDPDNNLIELSNPRDVEDPATDVAALLQRFGALDSASVSDALDGLGLPSGVSGIAPVWGQPAIVGLAATVQLEMFVSGAAGGPHIAASAVAQAGPADVLVVANQGRTDVSCWGGLLSLGASLRGVRGVIADGACRDVGEARGLGFPVFARGRSPVTARGRLQQRATGVPVQVAARAVAPGDVVVADETGVVFVPRDRAAEVLADAEALARREQAIAADLRAGVPLPEAMRDSRLAGTEETSR